MYSKKLRINTTKNQTQIDIDFREFKEMVFDYTQHPLSPEKMRGHISKLRWTEGQQYDKMDFELEDMVTQMGNAKQASKKKFKGQEPTSPVLGEDIKSGNDEMPS